MLEVASVAENYRQLSANEKDDSSENEYIEHSSSMPTIKREDADQLHLRHAVTSFLV